MKVKRIMVALLLVFAITAFVGCGDDQNDDAVPDNGTTNNVTEQDTVNNDEDSNTDDGDGIIDDMEEDVDDMLDGDENGENTKGSTMTENDGVQNDNVKNGQADQ